MMNEFTKGAAYIKEGSSCGDGALLVRDNAPQSHVQINPRADAELFALTLTTATKLSEMGFDAIKVLDVLPELVDVIDDANNDFEAICRNAVKILEQCRGESTREQSK